MRSMRIAVIGTDEESLHAIRQAKKQGHTVIAVDRDKTAPGLAEADVQINIDLADEEKVIEALKEQDIDMVLTAPIGRSLSTVGAVNDALGLPGISKRCAQLLADKYAFHNRLRNVRLRGGHCYLVNKNDPFYPDNIEYPAVFKPRFGSHGRSVHLLESPEELERLQLDIWGSGLEAVPRLQGGPRLAYSAEPEVTDGEEEKAYTIDVDTTSKGGVLQFAAKVKKTMEDRYRRTDTQDDPNDEYILEEAIKGAEYAVDAVIEGCNFELMLVRRKIIAAPPSRQAVAYITVKQGEEHRLVETIQEYMSKACVTLGLRDCMLHADISVLGSKCTAIELSASPAGHHIYDELLPMATGVDMCAQYLTYMAGEIHNFAPLNSKKLMLHYFNMENCFIHDLPTEEQVREILPENVKLRKWECNMKMLDYQGRITDEASLLGRGYFILEGPKDKTLMDAADAVMNLFEIK